MRDPEGLIARIRQIHRSAEASTPAPAPRNAPPRTTRSRSRLSGRESSIWSSLWWRFRIPCIGSRSDKQRFAEVEARMQPTALSAALSRDARERGL